MKVCASPATLQLLTQSRFIITELEHKGSLWGRFPEASGVSSLAGLRLAYADLPPSSVLCGGSGT